MDFDETIRRVKNDDPLLVELCIGDILSNKRTSVSLANALRGNTNLRRVAFREYGYKMEHFRMVLLALGESQVSKISVGPQSSMLEYEGTYAMAVGREISSLPNVRRLDLNMCHIGPEGAVALSNVLESNSTLTQLDLPENGIGDEGAAALGRMLRKNHTLKEIILDNNGITAEGQRSLRDAIFDDSSFGALEQSNHVLQSFFYNPRDVFGRGVLNDVLSSHAANLRSHYARQAVTKKLKRVLQKKYGVRLHFESFLSVDSRMLPHILGWIAVKCDLEMMYEFKPILLNLLEGRGH
jgi:hypothetical protein